MSWRSGGWLNGVADLDFDGFISHEFVPLRDPMTSLRQAVELFTV